MIKLKELLPYLQKKPPIPPEPIQVVMPEDKWDEFVEVPSDSPLLESVLDWEITDLAGAYSVNEGYQNVIRVAIRKTGGKRT